MMNITKERVDGFVKKVKFNFLNAKGVISSTYPPSDKTLANDLDDVVPYLLYFNESDFVFEQATAFLDVVGDFPTMNGRDIVIWRYDEWVGGLLSVQHELFLGKAVEILRDILNKCDQGSYLAFEFDLKRNRPIFNSFAPRAYGIFEVVFENREYLPSDLVERYETVFARTLESVRHYSCLPSVDKKGLPILSKKFRSWMLNCYYHKRGWKRSLLVALISLGDFRYAKTMKDNTNFLFSLLYYIKSSKLSNQDDILFYKKVLLKLASSCPVTTYVGGSDYTVCQTTSLIDNICDYCHFFGDDERLLERAYSLADFFIREFDGRNYLARHSGTSISHVDEVMDFAIALKRLFEVSGVEKYLEYANRIFESTIIHVDFEQGLVYKFYNHEEGVPSDVDPKFTFLYLKGLIIFCVVPQLSLYGKELYSLAKDR